MWQILISKQTLKNTEKQKMGKEELKEVKFYKWENQRSAKDSKGKFFSRI